jgi:two-component system OmpR family response regulator
MNILVVEDDPIIGKSLKKGLTEKGYHCVWVKNGIKGLQESLTQGFDAIVLDHLLPRMLGMDVLRRIREAGIRTPILFLTGLSAVEDRVTALQSGADDYLVKPFAFPELIARLEAVCRRTAHRPTPVMAASDITLNLATRRVQKGVVEIDLTPTEFDILVLLMRHAGQVVTRKMLCEHLWDSDGEGITNVIEVHMNRVRKKIDCNGNPSIIHTVRGRGYTLRAT